jgi:hypothetical protein
MPYYLSDKTNDDLQRLIQERQGPSPTGIGAGGASRHVCFVKVTAGTANPYTGTACYANADGSWVNYNDAVSILEVGGGTLTKGTYYLATRTGDDPSGEPVYLTSATSKDIAVACGLKHGAVGTADEGKILVNVSDLVGNGLVSGDNCKIHVKNGCGITLNGGTEVAVHADTLAGNGLVKEGTCSLAVNPGCGIEVVDDMVKVKLSDIVGNGLVSGDTCKIHVKPGCGITLNGGAEVAVHADTLAGNGLVKEGTCSLAVNPGCGIEVVDDKVKVKLSDLVGNGLVSGDTCKINVNPGCGITLNGGAEVAVDANTLAGLGLKKDGTCSLRIDPSGVAGPAFSAVTNVSLSISGCMVSLSSTVTPFEFEVNPGGAFVGFVAGTPSTSSQSIDLCGCKCISGSGTVSKFAMNRSAIKSQELGASLKFF